MIEAILDDFARLLGKSCLDGKGKKYPDTRAELERLAERNQIRQ
jgi:hypothetical protein